jgi:hypothetical protein
MPGNIPRWYLRQRGASFSPGKLPNGRPVEIGVVLDEGALGGVDFSVFVRELWDGNFKAAGAVGVYSGDYEVVADVLSTGNGGQGIWNTGNPTWAQLRDGMGEYTPLGSNEPLRDHEAVIARFQDWLKTHEVRECVNSVRTDWFGGDVLPWLQGALNNVLAQYVPEDEPPPAKPPAERIDWGAFGPLQDATGMTTTVGMLLVVKADANGRPVLSLDPTP